MTPQSVTSILEHVWACLACVCCGCVCGSGVRRQTHLSSRLVAVTASHMRGPGEGWGRGRVFPPSMPHSELVRSVDHALLSRKPDRPDDRDSLRDDAGSAVCQGWSGNRLLCDGWQACGGGNGSVRRVEPSFRKVANTGVYRSGRALERGGSGLPVSRTLFPTPHPA